LIDLQVLVQNLPASVNFDKISTMAKACGSVMAIKINRYGSRRSVPDPDQKPWKKKKNFLVDFKV
jgi:hypothetical protein